MPTPTDCYLSTLMNPERIILGTLFSIKQTTHSPGVTKLPLGRLFWLRATHQTEDEWQTELEEIPGATYTDPVEALIAILRLKGVELGADRLHFLMNLRTYVEQQLQAGAGDFVSEGPERKDGDE